MNNVIIGTDSGKFTVLFLFNVGQNRKSAEKTFLATEPEKVKEHLVKIHKTKGIDHVMTSSSMDFPEEENVTRQQIATLYKILGCQ